MSSYMCCTSDRSSKVATLKESQSRFLWLDPTRWVEKRSKKEVGLNFSLIVIYSLISCHWILSTSQWNNELQDKSVSNISNFISANIQILTWSTTFVFLRQKKNTCMIQTMTSLIFNENCTDIPFELHTTLLPSWVDLGLVIKERTYKDTGCTLILMIF